MKYKILLLLFILANIFYAQSISFKKEIGSFSNAGSFTYVSTGFFYVTDITNNEVYKLNLDGQIIKEIGGYGWTKGLFDLPIDIFANNLNVYVADKNNDRIQIFDRELNFLSQFKTNSNESDFNIFQKPTCFAISNQSDLLILDSYNSRILKYDLVGNFLQQIGNFDSGDFSLVEPSKFAVSPDGKIFIINEDRIFVFDQYGMGIIKLDLGFTATSIKIYNTILVINDDEIIKYIDLIDISKGFLSFNNFKFEGIIEAIIVEENLFLLKKNKIEVYEISNP